MSDQVDPWDAMVQNDDSDEDYFPTGADGIDATSSDDDELGDIEDTVLSSCMLSFSWMTSAECGTGCFAQALNSGTIESQMLQLSLHCRNSSQVGRVREW